MQTVVDFLTAKGFSVKGTPAEKIDDEQYDMLKEEFGDDKSLKSEAEQLFQARQKEKQKAKKEEKEAPEVIETVVPEEVNIKH